jgi:hypothetical protein
VLTFVALAADYQKAEGGGARHYVAEMPSIPVRVASSLGENGGRGTEAAPAVPGTALHAPGVSASPGKLTLATCDARCERPRSSLVGASGCLCGRHSG